MTINSKSNFTLPVIAIIIGVIGIVVTIIVFAFVFSPPALELTPTVTQPTSSLLGFSSPYQPESLPLPTYTPGPTHTSTIVPTNTPAPTRTLIVLPTLESNSQVLPLPDLTVTGISDPICAPDRIGTILEFTIFVRNIGQASTRYFGSFGTDVYLLLGQRRYGLDEWAEKFDGVVGSSVTEVFNLNPGDDIKFTVVIDLKGNKDLGIEVIANSGENPIREADTTNNTLTKYFSVYCY
jgi:hypothetical protein